MELPTEFGRIRHQRTSSVNSTQSSTSSTHEPKRSQRNINEYELGAKTAAGVAEDSRNVVHTNSDLTNSKMSTKQFQVKVPKNKRGSSVRGSGIRRNSTMK